MDSDSSLSALALAVSLAVYALASVAGAATASVRRDRIHALVSEGAPGAASLERLQSTPRGLTAVAVVKITSFAALLVSTAVLTLTFFEARWALVSATTFAALLATGLLHMLAEDVADRYGERVALAMAGPMRAVAWTLRPVLALVDFMPSLVPAGSEPQRNGAPELVPTEIDLPLESSTEALDEREVRMIRAVVRLDQTVAREIMVPRVDIAAAEVGTSIADLADQMATGAHSRIPVYDGDLDHITGIAYARDVLRRMVGEPEPGNVPIDSVVRPAIFIPESKTLEELLNDFQEMRVHMAIVVDEYGGVSGLVTIEDLLEEIVGEIQDEFETGEPDVEAIGEGAVLLDARVSIDQLNELLDVTVEGDGFDTVGGFVYQRLGKIPSPGDTLTHDGLEIEVISTVGRRLKRLRVVRSSPQADPSGSA
ncbi:MAG: HlyC/CorC family transporter [Chloroflexi bacterium]|nr:HlyC/CorC family transporter [Chloroflexota bacterium]